MASRYQLVITSAGITGTTGHHTVQCHIQETHDDGAVVNGLSDTWGIESIALQRQHGGDVVKWRNWIGNQMLDRHRLRMMAQAEIATWHGKAFDIGADE